MKKVVFLLFLFSCSSYRQIEFINENMTRFNDKKEIEQNITPKILSLPVILQNRDIASISPLKDKKEALNNKQLYFQTLNIQMHKMGDILGIKTRNDRCPHFHSINLSVLKNLRIEVLEEKKNLPENIHYTNALNRRAFYPELHLPLKKAEQIETIFDLAKGSEKFNYKENVKQALSMHLSRTQKEVFELCETGSSANYFIFENLNSLASANPLTPKKENLETILKVSIFANDFLLSSLYQTTKTDSISAALNRVGSRWFQKYVATIISKEISSLEIYNST